jgi:hypothetical protein
MLRKEKIFEKIMNKRLSTLEMKVNETQTGDVSIALSSGINHNLDVMDNYDIPNSNKNAENTCINLDLIKIPDEDLQYFENLVNITNNINTHL